MKGSVEFRTVLLILLVIVILVSGGILYGFYKQQEASHIITHPAADVALPPSSPINNTSTNSTDSTSSFPAWEWSLTSSTRTTLPPIISWQVYSPSSATLTLDHAVVTQIASGTSSASSSYSIELDFQVDTSPNNNFCTGYFADSFRLLLDEQGDLADPIDQPNQCLPANSTGSVETSFVVSSSYSGGNTYIFQALNTAEQSQDYFSIALQADGTLDVESAAPTADSNTVLTISSYAGGTATFSWSPAPPPGAELIIWGGECRVGADSWAWPITGGATSYSFNSGATTFCAQIASFAGYYGDNGTPYSNTVLVADGVIVTNGTSTMPIAFSSADARDAQRISDLQGLQGNIELYYDSCGYYYPGGDASATTTICSNFIDTPNSSDSWEMLSSVLLDLTIPSPTRWFTVQSLTIPQDPLSGRQYYYGVAPDGSRDIVAGVLEDASNSVFANYIPPSTTGLIFGVPLPPAGCNAPDYCIVGSG